MAQISTSDITEGLRVAYTRNQRLEYVLHGRKHRALLNGLKKVKFGGRSYPMPVLGDWGGMVSATFSDAQATAGAAPVLAEFDPGATLAEFHRPVQIDTQALARAEGDPEGFLRATVLRTDLALEATADELERQLFGDGWNSIGSLSNSSFATTTMTLNTATDAKYFRVGMRVVFAATLSGALRDSGDYLTVTAKDPINGTVELDANLSNIASIAQNDYVFPKGAAANNGGARLGVCGLGAWASTPTASEDFLGVDRSTNPAALAMLTTTGDDADIQAAIENADALANDIAGGVRSKAILNPRDFALLANQITGQTQYSPGTRVQAGYSYVTVNSVSGPIECMSSPYCPKLTVYVLDWDSFQIVHLFDNPVTIDAMDGSMARKISDASGIEIRGLGYVQLGCSRPAGSIAITLS